MPWCSCTVLEPTGKACFSACCKPCTATITSRHRIKCSPASKQEEHPTGLAALMGSRLASIPEVPQGARFNEEALKRASGGDELTARFMRQDYFSFIPQFLPVIVGNSEPSTRDVGESMRRRLHVLPFDFVVPEGQRDKGLLNKLKGELDEIIGVGHRRASAISRKGPRPTGQGDRSHARILRRQ